MTDEVKLENIHLVEPKTKEELDIAYRCRMYHLFSHIFRYPDSEFRNQVRSGELRKALETLSENLPYKYDLSDEEKSLLTFSESLKDEDIEVEFIRFFEAGPGNPPCSLVEGSYRDGRRSILKDLILFYNYFGLSYKEGSMEDRPDHTIYEMEFLHYLTYLNLRAISNKETYKGYVLAQRDFIERHPRQWVGKMAEQADKVLKGLKEEVNREVIAFYHNLIQLLNKFIEADYSYVRDSLAI